MLRPSQKAFGLAFLAACLTTCLAHGQGKSSVSMSTPERWKGPGWWPTKGTAPQSDYSGATVCNGCHRGIAKSQQQTPMYQAASLASESSILHLHPDLKFWDVVYSYQLSNHDEQTTFTTRGESGQISGLVGWAFGLGELSQTYILKRKHVYIESRLSFYTSLQGLDITPGQDAAPPNNVENALGNPIDEETLPRCFGCHTTGSTVAGVFDPEHATMGITCEACHGPGVRHVAAMNAGTGGGDPGMMLNPKRMSPTESVDFCGACHRTPVDVAAFMPSNMGITNIRFQPARLERSLCWGNDGDPRITCVACHDPHKPLVREASAYDAKCLACHAAFGTQPSSTQVSACKVAAKDCVSCHMPKYEIRWIHGTFTDHYIRVVKPGTGFRE
jgi:hypothetical protein